MPGLPTGLVDIVRDFLEAHRCMRRVFERHRQGELRYDELEELVGDDESSVLFRLKERCHSLFRPKSASSRVVPHREALFDLAVGSLFHEAMKLRENVYQWEVYGPRVRALRSETSEDAKGLFEEFEKILDAVSQRIEEGLRETEVLLERTRDQLRVLMGECGSNGNVTRYLVENRAAVEETIGEPLDLFLAEIHGEAAEGYAFAGRSYLLSGYFDEAERAFAEAMERGGDREQLERHCAYARGMAAYCTGDYEKSLEWLGEWAECPEDPDLVEFAHSAVSRIGELAEAKGRAGQVAAATALLEQIGSARASSQRGAATAP